MKLSNKVYDILRPCVDVIFPALITYYCTVADLCGWENALIVSGIMTATVAFLGSCLQVSSAAYNAGLKQ